MRNKITIIVASGTAGGKTTLTQLIANFLREHNCAVTIQDDNILLSQEALFNGLARIADHTDITVQAIQVRKEDSTS